MREWELGPDEPLSLRIAADARLSHVDYFDDQIWELCMQGEHPLSLSLETNYGLRARSMRIFPGFVRRDQYMVDPGEFAGPPIVRRFFPNYLRIEFSPFEDLCVQAEYWVPGSHTVAGRFKLMNLGPRPTRLRLRLHALLQPGDEPQAMREVNLAGAVILAGRTGNLEPVLFMAGGAAADPAAYPALALEQMLAPGVPRMISWAHAGLDRMQDSFKMARDQAARHWDGEVARLELVNASQVEIETGDQDWDAAFAFSQKVALGSFVSHTTHLPHASIIDVRAPSQGFSQRGDGRDYDVDWDGQSVQQAYLVLSQILNSAPELGKGLILNFLAAQSPEGHIDWRPGLGGQRNKALCIPLLATMAWRIFQHTEDKDFLRRVLPGLLAFNESWFSPEHDRDEDGHPEWDHTLHAGFDDWPSFVRWRKWGGALDIRWAETHDLSAYLHRECQSLVKIARTLGREEPLSALTGRMERLRASVERAWEEEGARYRHLDRELHVSPPGKLLGSGEGDFELGIDQQFDQPGRVLIRIRGPESEAKGGTVYLHGRGRRGRHRVETMGDDRFQWFWELGSATSEKIYAEIERVEARGFGGGLETEIWIADFTRGDVTNLMPLWAGLADAERARQIVSKTLTDPDQFWRRYGIPECSALDPAYPQALADECCGVSMFWNTLMGEALVHYGYLERAAELVGRLMAAIVIALKQEKGFSQMYSPDRELSFGPRDHVAGLAPLHLFLETLGVRLLSPHRIAVRGRNPYPWPVVIRWKGLEVRRDGVRAYIRFPNGQQETVEGEAPRLIEQGSR
jgi:hypothetical protein